MKTDKKIFDDYAELYVKYSEKYGKIALLYELGSFYEIFGVNNEKEKIGNIEQIVEDIELTLTKSDKKIDGNSRSNPQKAGFPVKSLEDKFLKKLISHGYTVVIYSQVDDGKKKKRVLDKIVSPSTYIENICDYEEVNLVSIYTETKKYRNVSISVLDTSTGNIKCYSIINSHEDAADEANKLIEFTNPKEILVSGDSEFLNMDNRTIHQIKLDSTITKLSYQNEFLKKIYPKHGNISPIEYIDFEMNKELTISLIHLLNFAYEHDSNILVKISKPKIEDITKYLHLEQSTIQYLNILSAPNCYKSLFDVLSHTSTSMGKRLLKDVLTSPITDPNTLEQKYEEIETFDWEKYEPVLKGIPDIERLHRLMFIGKLEPADFTRLDVAYEKVLDLINSKPCESNIRNIAITGFKKFIREYKRNFNFDEMKKYTLATLATPIFNEGVCTDIDELDAKLKQEELQFEEYAKTISDKIGENSFSVRIDSTPSEGFFLTTTKVKYNKYLKNVPFTQVKQNTNSVKLFDKNIVLFSENIIRYKDKLIELNKFYYKKMLEQFSNNYSKVLKHITKYVAHVDYVKSCSKVKDLYHYVRPKIVVSDVSYIEGIEVRHPIIERYDEQKYIPNDVSIGKENNGMLLFGVNGSGKSLYLKSIALNVLMAQCGMFVSAKEFVFNPFKYLITKISMTDDMYQKRSTFAHEMIILRKMIEKSGIHTLALADELCAGTTTNDAISIVASAIKHLLETNTCFVFTTHLHQLTSISIIQKDRLKWCHMTVSMEGNNIVYERSIKEGTGPAQYGIDICRFLGVGGNDFIKNATKVSFELGEKKEIVSTKQSRYNKNVYVDHCERCGATENLHTHHTKEQHTADKYGNIESFHKNSKFNLEVLCQRCHVEHHHSN